MEEEVKYEAAIKELEQIVRDMETGSLDIDSLGEKLKRAQTLIKLCKDKLAKTNEEINNIINAKQI